MRKSLVLFFMMIAVAGVAQQSYDGWFEEGNAAYNEGNYEQAMTAYQNIVDAGMESATLFYNMGNTYYVVIFGDYFLDYNYWSKLPF